MGMTMIERILARKAGRSDVYAGDTVTVEVDMTVLIDLQFATMWMQPLRINDAAKVAIVMDHAVPAPTIKDAAGGPKARRFASEFGIERFYDVGRHGICHQVIAENALARPGEILACTDSHTCAGGAYNTAARGLGPAEVYSILCTGVTWFHAAPTIRYELTGALPAGVSGKDVFLYIANEYGDAANTNLEYGGPGLASVRSAIGGRSPLREPRFRPTSPPSPSTTSSPNTSRRSGSAATNPATPTRMPPTSPSAPLICRCWCRMSPAPGRCPATDFR